jgi:hypothetical protein
MGIGPREVEEALERAAFAGLPAMQEVWRNRDQIGASETPTTEKESDQ